MKYNVGEDPQKKERYSRIKQCLVRRHIDKLRSATRTEETKTDFVSREREVELVVPSEGDWPKNVDIMQLGEKVAAPGAVQEAIRDYDRCAKQEESIREYIEYLSKLKADIKGKMVVLAQGAMEPEPEEEEGDPCGEAAQSLREALDKKAALDRELAGTYKGMMMQQPSPPLPRSEEQ